MANRHQSRRLFCSALIQNIDVLNFNDFQTEHAAGKEGLIEILWSLKHKVEPNEAMEKGLQRKYAFHLQYRNAFRQVLTALNAANIPVINMRGLSLAESYGDQIIFRPQSDIDLLFNESDTLMAKQTLGAIGFSPSRSYPDVFVRGNVQLDLHTEPLGINRIQAWHHLTSLRAPDFFKHAEPGKLMGEDALIVHPRVMLPYLCFHALKHSFERLVWLYDIALLAKQIDETHGWQEVEQGIQEYQLERPCYYALAYAKINLGAPVPQALLDTIKPHMSFFERRLFKRHMNHQIIPFLAERLFSRMQPSLKHRIEFWRETIYPRYEIREQMANGGCVKCSFIRTRLKQLFSALKAYAKEMIFAGRA